MAQNISNPNCADCASRVSSAFASLPESELPILSTQKICRWYRKGTSLYYANDRAAGLYCVHDGKVKVVRISSDGREQILRLAKPGDALGYRALLGDGMHSTSAVALEDAHVCFIPREMFFSLISSRPVFSLRLFELLSTELEETERKVVEMAQKPVRERLAEALLLLKSTYGLKEDNRTLNVKITREDLASIVGSATESVIRNLTELKAEGVVGLEGRSILVLDSPALMKVANVEE